MPPMQQQQEQQQPQQQSSSPTPPTPQRRRRRRQQLRQQIYQQHCRRRPSSASAFASASASAASSSLSSLSCSSPLTPLSKQQQPRTPTTRMDCSLAKCLILLLFYILNAVNGEIILRIDPLALLSATLRTYQKATCDTDQVVIACPRGTSISIEFAQYNKFIAKDGISIEELCPTTDNGNHVEIRGKANHLLRGSIFGSPTQKVPANRYVNGGYGYGAPFNVVADVASSSTSNTGSSSGSSTSASATSGSATADADPADDNTPENCMWPNALQYSLLQTVVEACQKKKRCKFHGSPQFYGLGASGVGDTSGSSSYHSSTASSNAISVDPCPKRRKIVEVAYKCRPYEFRSKVACHNDVAQLECNPYSRIAVYSASFGRTEYESIQCPQPQGVREETCLASYATETVMQICHGRRRCNLAADANTFGSPCQPNSRMYLKVVYTCVPKLVLKENNESDVEPDETEDFENDTNIWYDDEPNYKESEAIPKLSSNTTANAQRNNASSGSGSSSSGPEGSAGNGTLLGLDADSNQVNPVMTHSADLSLEDDQERLYLYLLISGSLGVLFCIVIVAARVVMQKRQNSAGLDGLGNENAKAAGQGGGGVAGGPDGGLGDETTIPNGFNDTISEIDADIDLTTAIPVPSVSKNENYVSYRPTSSLYGNLSAAGIASPAAAVSPLGGTGPATSVTAAGLIANPLMVGARQSPDIIGISSSTFVATSNANNPVAGILTPAIVIGANNSLIAGAGPGGINCGSTAISTMVPITSLAQYTTAPTIRAGYIINPESVLQRPSNTPTPPTPQQLQQQMQLQAQQQQQQPLSHLSAATAATSTLRRNKPTAGASAMLQPQLSYDGTAPRTLSTGVPVNSQFYYG